MPDGKAAATAIRFVVAQRAVDDGEGRSRDRCRDVQRAAGADGGAGGQQPGGGSGGSAGGADGGAGSADDDVVDAEIVDEDESK